MNFIQHKREKTTAAADRSAAPRLSQTHIQRSSVAAGRLLAGRRNIREADRFEAIGKGLAETCKREE
jgi:hypothetical protein